LRSLNRPISGHGVDALRKETGLKSYEVSRACSLLVTSELVQILQTGSDGRKKILVPTTRESQILNRILSAAANRLWKGTFHAGRSRRVKETTGLLRRANDRLLGSLQLSFFDKDLYEICS
jgi:DNA-binding MarR family transcriptional regulator